mmetsp:Transcript_18754/g.24845  ORF Transcript_18754/g.24845 Transcript_18754/m.24845 type:complete len:473 (-) Transcript_18754:278-1696(-)
MLLVIPLKTTQEYDLSSPLTTYLQNVYPNLYSPSSSSYVKETLHQDILRISTLRNSISSSFGMNNGSTSSSSNNYHVHALALSNHVLNDCMNYHACLLECHHRSIVFSSSSFSSATLKWKSAFSIPTSENKNGDELLQLSKSSNLQFERVCVLFNIASLLSYQASSLVDATADLNVNDESNSASTREGRTKAIQSYQSAAAVLHYIIQTMGYQNSNASSILEEEGLHITPDMTKPSLYMLLYILMAQGQALSYHHLSTTSSNSSLLSKLAQSAATFYNKALQQSQHVNLQRSTPHVSTPYGCHLKLCSLYYHAMVQYHVSKHAIGKESKYGQEIARLQFCMDICSQGILFYENAAEKNNRNMNHADNNNTLEEETNEKDESSIFPLLLSQSTDIYSSIQKLYTTVEDRLSVAMKDNQEIYYDIVPQRKELAAIVGVDLMSKHLNDGAEGGGKGLDERLFPENLEEPIFQALP